MGHGPPSDVPASELWARLSSTERPFEVVDFPRTDADGNPLGQIAIRVLTQHEAVVAQSEATKVKRKLLADAGNQNDAGDADVYNNVLASEILFRACRTVDNQNMPVFPRPADVRERLTTDEIGVLMNQYAMVQAKLGPITSYMSDAEVEQWISVLGKGGEEFSLAFLSSEAKNELLLRMASLLCGSQTDTSSAG